MKIMPIDNKIVTPKTTGYASCAGLFCTAITGISNNKCIRKAHKPLAYITGFLTLLHLGLVEYMHYYWKHKQM
jgi:cytochrome b561